MLHKLIAAWLRLWLGVALSVLMLCATQAVADGLQVIQPASDTAADAVGLTKQADSLLAAGRFGEAEPLYRRALAIREKALGPDHTSTLDMIHNPGNLYGDQGKLDVAEQMCTRAQSR